VGYSRRHTRSAYSGVPGLTFKYNFSFIESLTIFLLIYLTICTYYMCLNNKGRLKSWEDKLSPEMKKLLVPSDPEDASNLAVDIDNGDILFFLLSSFFFFISFILRK
jgi:hypothetical protein